MCDDDDDDKEEEEEEEEQKEEEEEDYNNFAHKKQRCRPAVRKNSFACEHTNVTTACTRKGMYNNNLKLKLTPTKLIAHTHTHTQNVHQIPPFLRVARVTTGTPARTH